MEVRAECIDKYGRTLFVVKHKQSSVKDAMIETLAKINHEFDHCFEADNWGMVNITITR